MCVERVTCARVAFSEAYRLQHFVLRALLDLEFFVSHSAQSPAVKQPSASANDCERTCALLTS